MNTTKFGGGPSTVVALFAYGGLTRPTHACILRDAVFAARVAAGCEAQAATLAAAVQAAGDDAGKRVMEAIEPLRNWPVIFTHPHDDALIDRSRAWCVKSFLEDTKAEVLVMVDHDQDWCGAGPDYEGDICHIARRCAETKGVVGACVSKKTHGQGIASMWHESEYGEHQLGGNTIARAYYVGAAFTAFHRSCLEAVVATVPQIPPGFSPVFLPVAVPHPTCPGQELHLSEDWAFCHRAAALGFSVHLALRPLVRHWGYYPYDVIKDAMADPTPKRKISLIHATRGRPVMAMQARCEWLSRLSGRHTVEYIRVVDSDDQSQYLDDARTIRGEHRGNVDAYNAGAREAGGEILVQMHDDVTPPADWDAEIAKLLDPERPQVLHVSDGTTCNGEKVIATIMICTRPWVEKLGGLFHPEYLSISCDNDATEKAIKDKCLVDGRALLFKHAWEGPDRDETQRRSYAPERWTQGAEVLERRRAAGFPDVALDSAAPTR